MSIRSDTALVSYRSSSHKRTRGRTGPDLVTADPDPDGEDVLSIFTPLPPCPYPRKREVIDDITGEIHYDPYPRKDESGEVQMMRCGNNSCPVCGPLNHEGSPVPFNSQTPPGGSP